MADRYWVGGAGTWNNSSTTNWSTGSGGSGGASAPTSADNVFFDSGSNATAYTVTVASTAVCANLTIAGPTTGNVTFNFGASTLTVYGSYSNAASGLTWGTTGTITFAATSGSNTITTNGVTMGVAVTINGIGGTFVQQDALTTSYAFTFTNGTYNQNNLNLTCLTWSSSNSNTRVYTPGTGTTFVTGNNATILNAGTLTGFSYTTAPLFKLSYSGSTGTRTVTWGNTAGGVEANAANFAVTAGSDIVTIGGSNNARYGAIDFTGFSGSFSSGNLVMVGDLTMSPTMTYQASVGAIRFSKSSGTQNVTTNGILFDINVSQLQAGSNVIFTDNFTMGSAKVFTHTAGTVNFTNKILTVGTYTSTGSSVRSLVFGTTGKLVAPGAGASAFVASGSNYTTTGTGTISMTSASAKTFAGGGFTYPTLDQAGAGALTITGSNTFFDITNTYATTGATTITFTAGTTQTVSSFTASGTSGNILTLQSSSAGSQFTLSDSSGTNSVNYCSIKDSSAIGGANWQSFTSNGNINGGNNIGWDFSAPDIVSYTAPIQLRSFTERRRFS